jgi:hypothetical protein
MPDEFPTLEAVAALATLAAFVRAVQVSAALGELRRLSAEVVLALESGDRETLRRVSEESEGQAFSEVATALFEALGSDPNDREGLKKRVQHAAHRVAKRARRASASGAFTGILLVGLLSYAVISRVSPGRHAAPSTLFDVIVLLGVLVLAVGIYLNQRLSTETRRAARRMLEAATSGAKEPV